MTLTRRSVAEAVERYAPVVHGLAPADHHVASPLGAWLVLALAAFADDGRDPQAREQLEAALGCSLPDAADAATTLLDRPHPAVTAAAALWWSVSIEGPALAAYAESLPARATRERVRNQQQLDDWAREHSLGMIERFPLTLDPTVVLVLASALATRVRWIDPFDAVPASALAAPGGRFSGRVARALRSTDSHDVRLVATRAAGLVGAHVAASGDGLAVVSVLPGPDVDRATGLAAAYEVAGALDGDRIHRHVSLYDVPLGPSELGEVDEDRVEGKGSKDLEAGVAVLPSWTARSELNLVRDPAAGFHAAGRLLGNVAPSADVDARQVAVATYGREGFEGAAVTGMALLASWSAPRELRRRTLVLRFDRPYAAVAVAVPPPVGPHEADGAESPYRAWFGLPVFGAWITEPAETPQP